MLIYNVNSSSKQKCISTKALNTFGVKLAGSKLGVSFKKDQRVMWHMQTNTSTAIVQTTNYLNMWEHSKLHIIVLLCKFAFSKRQILSANFFDHSDDKKKRGSKLDKFIATKA